MNPNDYELINSQLYVKPETATNDANALTQALRNNITQTNQDIVDQTAKLGDFGYTKPQTVTNPDGSVTTTMVPMARKTNTNWVNKYEQPAVDAAAANINAAATETALNLVGSNKLAQLKLELDQATDAAKARKAARDAAAAATTNTPAASYGGTSVKDSGTPVTATSAQEAAALLDSGKASSVTVTIDGVPTLFYKNSGGGIEQTTQSVLSGIALSKSSEKAKQQDLAGAGETDIANFWQQAWRKNAASKAKG